MSKFGLKSNWDCTVFCRSLQHSSCLMSVITKKNLSDRQIACYLYEICCNFAKIQDEFGRSTLHLAASCGRADLCLWLVTVAGANVNLRDWESGYTPLQRSLFYGNIDVAVRLIEIGADISVVDREDFSPLALLTIDRLQQVNLSKNLTSQVYVWGSNPNFTLGIGTDDPKKHPDLLDYFKRNNISIKQVCTDEFHSVFISNLGRVWVCGHGQGGRLGTFKEKPLLIPTTLSISNEECVMAATALNHTLLLCKSGSVLAFGSNSHHQLGVSLNSEVCLSPKHVNLLAAKSYGTITGICAAKYHSLFFNANVLLGCGLNVGQLGSRTSSLHIITPQQLVEKEKIPIKIKNVATSTASVVYSLSNGDVFTIYRFHHKKIASKISDIVKINAFGGYLSNESTSETGEYLKILFLIKRGTVILWQENVSSLMRCTFGIKRPFLMSDIFFNENGILFATVGGEAFHGIIKELEPMPKLQEMSRKKHLDEKVSREKLGKCLILVKRIPYIHRALSVTSDPKGKNFAVIQAHPSNSLEVCVERSTSNMEKDFKSLLLEASEDDDIHDIIFNISGTLFAAHRYILAVNGFPFDILIKNNNKNDKGKLEIKILNSYPIIFHEFLAYLYTGHCQLFNVGPCNVRLSSLNENPIKLLFDLGERFSILPLKIHLNTLCFEDGCIVSKDSPAISLPCKKERSLYPEFYDVEIKTEDGKTIKAHKCVLTARLPYFHSMFLSGWSEAKNAHAISLQTNSFVAESLIDFLYVDRIPDYISRDDLDNIIRLLILADQLLIKELKEDCELLLANSINLKNCATLLQICSVYNTVKLKEPVMRFIIFNLNAVLESRVLETLDNQLLQELSEYYKNYSNKFSRRIITPYSNAPSDEEVIDVADSAANISDTFFATPGEAKDIYHKCTKSPPIISKRKYSKRLSQNFEKAEESGVVPEINVVTQVEKENIHLDELEFPSLLENKCRKNSYSNKVHNRVWKVLPHVPQKQLKKLEAEKLENSSPPKTQFKGWAVVSSPGQNTSVLATSNYTSNEPNLIEIISNEQKEKDNLKKMKNKSFQLTQIEDAAMDDLISFYNAHNIFDERITVKRVLPLNIAQPVWIYGQKKTGA